MCHVWVLKWLSSQWGPCNPAVENPSKEYKGLRFNFFISYPCVWYNFFFFSGFKILWTKTVLFYKNSWKPTVFIEQDQGKGDLETMVMREVNRILKKSKKHFFLLKKKRVIWKNEIWHFSGKQWFTYMRMTLQTK